MCSHWSPIAGRHESQPQLDAECSEDELNLGLRLSPNRGKIKNPAGLVIASCSCTTGDLVENELKTLRFRCSAGING